MRSITFHIIAISSLALLSCHSSKKAGKAPTTLPGNWQAQPVTIDGDSKDWPSPYPNYDSKSKVAYATSNDRRYVYISLETGDEFTQIKILKAGMTVAIDTSGNREPQFRINYPLPNDNDLLELPQTPKGEKTPQHNEKQLSRQIKKMMGQTTQFSLDGFADCNGGYSVTQNLPCGIKVRAAIDEYSELVWEAAIPVKLLFNKDTLTMAEAGKPISMCVSVKGLKKEKKSSDDTNNNIGTGGTGMTGMGSGGRGGGGKGASGHGRTVTIDNPMDQLYTNTKTWKQFGLMVQP